MVQDTAGLLDALGIDDAHILGVSLGGRIAADLAHWYPQKVRSLILASTTLTMRRSRPWWRLICHGQEVHPQWSRCFGCKRCAPTALSLTSAGWGKATLNTPGGCR